MWPFSWLTAKASAPPQAAPAAPTTTASDGFCSTSFPEMWESFVAAFTDSTFLGACTAPPPRGLLAQPLPTALPAAKRLVAIGDIHGDYGKARRAFRLAGLTDEADRWAGGDTVCVQVGDILDRGPEELSILLFLERLQAEAAAAGGALHVLNGNHETMNVGGNHRYAHAKAPLEFERWNSWQQAGRWMRGACGCTAELDRIMARTEEEAAAKAKAAAAAEAAKAAAAAAASSTPSSAADSSPPSSGAGLAAAASPAAAPAASNASGSTGAAAAAAAATAMRTQLLKPGSAITRRFFAQHPTVLQVGSTLFVHGGVLPQHVEYGLTRINEETQRWMVGPEAGGGGGAAAAGGGSNASSSSSSSSSNSSGSSSGSAVPSAEAPAAAPVGSTAAAQTASAAAPPSTAAPAAATTAPPPPPPTSVKPPSLRPPSFLLGSSAIVWARDFSANEEANCDCSKLQRVLGAVAGAERMVVGHTIQDGGINASCGNRVFKIDVGMSKGCGDREVEVLEILDDRHAFRLREGQPRLPLTPAPDAAASTPAAAAAAAAAAAGTAAAAAVAVAPSPASASQTRAEGGENKGEAAATAGQHVAAPSHGREVLPGAGGTPAAAAAAAPRAGRTPPSAGGRSGGGAAPAGPRPVGIAA